MYLQTKEQHNNAQTRVQSPTRVNPISIFVMGLVLSTADDTKANVFTDNSTKVEYDNFYNLLHKPASDSNKPVSNYLLNQVAGKNSVYSNSTPDLISDQDLAFNFLWMHQYQSSKSYKEGGAAIGKLMRIGLKSLYKNHTGTVDYEDSHDDEISVPLSSMNYRLRLSSNNVKLSLKYKF